jgi:DNA/RNA-binding domain of Phe-tRNA-synthetase-like protein
MKLLIDESIRNKYPDLRIGIVTASNVDNENYSDELEKYLKEQFLIFSHKYNDVSEFLNEKNIICWQDTYRSFGVNPKKKKPTAEALLLRTIKNGFIPHINAAVDCYLAAETLFCLPIGGYDLDRVYGDICLKIAKGGEPFIGVGSDSEELIDTNEVIYADNKRVLTRRWNYRDCDYTKIDVYSKNIALFTEAPYNKISTDEIESTINRIAFNIEKYCGAQTNVMVLANHQNELIIV